MPTPKSPSSRATWRPAFPAFGALLADSGRVSEAIATYQQAIVIQEGLVKSNPGVQLFQNDLTRSLTRTGILLDQKGRREEALRVLEKSLALCEALTQANPSVTSYQSELARCQHGMAVLLEKMGRPSEARAAWERARAIQERLATDQPDNAYAQAEASSTGIDVGIREARRGDRGLGLKLCRQALDRLERSRSPLPVILHAKARAHAQIGHLLSARSEGRAGDSSDTRSAHLDAAISLLRRAAVSGYRDTTGLDADAAFDPVRSRPDFQLLLLDIVFPAEALALSRPPPRRRLRCTGGSR